MKIYKSEYGELKRTDRNFYYQWKDTKITYKNFNFFFFQILNDMSIHWVIHSTPALHFRFLAVQSATPGHILEFLVNQWFILMNECTITLKTEDDFFCSNTSVSVDSFVLLANYL
jgi:hypothetical protein